MEIDQKLLPWQKEFLFDRRKIKILSGSAGTGKSDICRTQIVFNCYEVQKTYCMVAARGFDNCIDIIVKPIVGYLHEKGIQHTLQNPQGKNTARIEFRNGSCIYAFSTSDLQWKLKGREFHTIFIDEAVNIPALMFDSTVSQCLTRIRTTDEHYREIPAMQLLMATNPGVKSHPLYRDYLACPPIDVYARHIKFEEGWYRGNQDYKATLERLSPVQRAIYYEGEWGALEGQVFRINTFKNPAPPIDYDNRFHISFDYGFSPDPMVYLLIENIGSKLVVRRELELRETPVNRHSQYLDPWFAEFKIAAFTGDTSAGSSEVRNLLQNKYNLSYYPTRKLRNEGWTTLSDLFDRNEILFDRTPRCVESLESLVWMPSKMDIQPGDDHHADALRYYAMSPLYTGRSAFIEHLSSGIKIHTIPLHEGTDKRYFTI